MSEKKAIVAALDKIDWNFPRAGTWSTALHSLHWFPGNFIPQIPGDLIQVLSTERAVVFDPFCGSGTTGIEAVMLERMALVADVSPVCQLISGAKLGILTNASARQEISALDLPPFVTDRPTSLPFDGEGEARLREWFHPDTLDQLGRVWKFVAECQDATARLFLQMLFSDTLFACASTLGSKTVSGGRRRHHWGWVADNVVPKPPVWHDAVRYFRERLHRAKQIVFNLPPCHAPFDVRREDIRHCSYESGGADLIVTSPPYIGMIDYTSANRLTYLWNGWNLIEDRSSEIGARYRRNARRAQSQYVSEMQEAIVQLSRVLKPGGYCAIVVGASRKYPEVSLKVIELLTRHMELVWGPQRRVPSRRRVSDQRGSSSSEVVCVLRNG